MLLSKVPSDWEWRRLHERLDRAIAEAAYGYMLRLATRHVSINVGKLSDELDELRFGREPDYDLPGFPLVYALKYMPRRVVSIYGSLVQILGEWHPLSVLDIGSGTGATALALDLLNLACHLNLVGIEPSREMISFSECSRYRDRVSTSYKQCSITDFSKMSMNVEPFDLVVFSACLPYTFDEWGHLMSTIGDYRGKESKMILVIEPDAKQDLVDSFRCRLTARGWPTITFCCHALPSVIKDEALPLRDMQNICRRLGLESEPKTWWNPPNDRFLIANPIPSEAVRAFFDICGESPASAQLRAHGHIAARLRGC